MKRTATQAGFEDLNHEERSTKAKKTSEDSTEQKIEFLTHNGLFEARFGDW